ncbi:hypothetical protein AMJ48_01075 [Parcubacteria bacterium DG_74_1]|nr:MAG: hypothetical protein AMJ48_01075 [Parcubacteria bacterium DG_74_1]
MTLNYQKICQELLNDLPQKQKEILLRRFGLKGSEKETLEGIGKDFGITRERVRQIEEDGFLKIKPKIIVYQNVFQYFKQYFKNCGGLKKEEILLKELGGKRYQPQVYFLLTVSDDFERFSESVDLYSFWSIDRKPLDSLKNIIGNIYRKFKKAGKPLGLKGLASFSNFKFLPSYLEISKKFLKNSEGLYGLKGWPEINPRGIKDKAYLVFKKIGKPLHFNEVAKSIEGALVQTVHNELIKDPRFVLVGRGIYALKEWGYEPGQVRDVIAKTLRENGPLTQGEIIKRVSRQRMVKENTILLNLNNKKNFLRDSQGKYKALEI